MAYDSTGKTSTGKTSTGKTTDDKPARQRTGLAPKQILATGLIVIAVVLGIENANRHATVQLIGPSYDTQLWILVAVPLVLGLLAGLLLAHKSHKSK